MKIRLSHITLFAVLATTSAFSADRHAGRSSSPDAQSQAGNLLQGAVTAPATPHSARRAAYRADSGTWISQHGGAQAQAADVLRGSTPASPITLRQALAPVAAGQSSRAMFVVNSEAHQDVQAQARRLLTIGYSRTDPTRVSR